MSLTKPLLSVSINGNEMKGTPQKKKKKKRVKRENSQPKLMASSHGWERREILIVLASKDMTLRGVGRRSFVPVCANWTSQAAST